MTKVSHDTYAKTKVQPLNTPPHVVLEPGSHPTEETYVILEGEGEMTFHREKRTVRKGDFIYLPPWCVHGIENTGKEALVVLICTSPPNP